jgi:nucleotide-binding universal stress UspA family protein
MSTDPIVAGTDGSPRAEVAVDTAGELAQALGAPVHIVCVPGAIAGRDWPQRITAQEIVADSSDRLQGKGISVQTHLPNDRGDAALALVAVADDVGAQMLVVGNKGMTGLGRLLGSFPNRVSHHSRSNVLIVPTRSQSVAEFGGASIVVGIDGSSAGTRAVSEAIGLAGAFGGSLHMVPIAAGSAGSALTSAVAEAAGREVDAVAHEPQRDPVDALLGVAEQTGAVMIVVGSEGASEAERELASIPNKLSHKDAVSVLIVFAEEASDGEREAEGRVTAVDT